MTLKNRIVAVLLLCSLYTCSHSMDKAKGVIHVEPLESMHIGFFSQPDETSEVVFELYMLKESIGMRTCLDLDRDTLRFEPLYFLPKQSVLVLQVVEVSEGWARVITNQRKKASFWMQLNKQSITRWDDFLLSTYRIRPQLIREEFLRKEPNNNSVILFERLDNNCLKPLSALGDWLRVKNIPELCQGESLTQEPLTGYVRWRKGNDVLISFSL